jgi:CheY-like chemotaxis protein
VELIAGISCSVNHSMVLLAEDGELNLKAILAMLKHLGYSADTAIDGNEVLQALKRKRDDLILMNVGLPDMDGMEVTRRIRRSFQNGPRIIAVTAYALPGMKQECLGAGMDDFITKPFRIDELDAILRNCRLSNLDTRNDRWAV